MDTKALPLYRCINQVRAAKVERVIIDEDGGVIVSSTPRVEPFRVSQDYLKMYHPRPGGYYLCHEDGFESYVTEAAFRSLYVRCG